MPEEFSIGSLKAEARLLLREARVPPLRFTLVFLAVDLALTEISTAMGYLLGDRIGVAALPFIFAGVFFSLLSTVLLAGYACYCLGVARGEAMPYESLFDAFPYAGKVILLTLAQGLLIGAGLMLFVVPGVVLSFSYAFALYFVCEDPGTGVTDALRRSRLALQGFKWRLFLLLLSFLPLALLFALPLSVCEHLLRGAFPATLAGALLKTFVSGVLAAGASVYLTPYMALAQVVFFRRVTAQTELPFGEAPPDGPGL